jgi:hypothetical protein
VDVLEKRTWTAASSRVEAASVGAPFWVIFRPLGQRGHHYFISLSAAERHLYFCCPHKIPQEPLIWADVPTDSRNDYEWATTY